MKVSIADTKNGKEINAEITYKHKFSGQIEVSIILLSFLDRLLSKGVSIRRNVMAKSAKNYTFKLLGEGSACSIISTY